MQSNRPFGFLFSFWNLRRLLSLTFKRSQSNARDWTYTHTSSS
jgi:hypothetical protein